MKTWTFDPDGWDILRDGEIVAVAWVECDETAKFIVDACNAHELRRHLFSRMSDKLEAFATIQEAEDHLKEAG